MGDLYASAVGTTTLQLKEIPPRPPTFDGVVCLGELSSGVDGQAVRRHFDGVANCYLDERLALVFFISHEAACVAVAQGPGWLAAWASLRYNERAYDDRGWYMSIASPAHCKMHSTQWG